MVLTYIKPINAQRGFGLIETSLALLLLSVVTLATISLLATMAGSYAWRQRESNLAQATLATGERLRQGVWMSGYGLADTDEPLHITGAAPTATLGLRYKIGSASVFNRYDCARSRRAGVRTNSWTVRRARYPGARAELVCQGRTLGILSQQVLGINARGVAAGGSVLDKGTGWQYDAANPQGVEVELLLQYPAAEPQRSATSHPFSWQGIGLDANAPVLWTRLRLPRAIDFPRQ